MFRLRVILFSVLAITANICTAAGFSEGEKKDIVQKTAQLYSEHYIFPDIGKKISDRLIQNYESGSYIFIGSPEALASQLTIDVRSVNNDKHLRVSFDPHGVSRIRTLRAEKSDSYVLSDADLNWLQSHNYGFEEVKILDGNIGYLKFNQFVDPHYAGDVAVAAMQFLSNTHSLIIDLRDNYGGSPKMIQLLSSYLFDPEPVHLNSFEARGEDFISQMWTLPFVPGKRLPDVDIYLLTSLRTFSGQGSLAIT